MVVVAAPIPRQASTIQQEGELQEPTWVKLWRQTAQAFRPGSGRFLVAGETQRALIRLSASDRSRCKSSFPWYQVDLVPCM